MSIRSKIKPLTEAQFSELSKYISVDKASLSRDIMEEISGYKDDQKFFLKVEDFSYIQNLPGALYSYIGYMRKAGRPYSFRISIRTVKKSLDSKAPKEGNIQGWVITKLSLEK
jgi:hypothetical protein